MNEILWKPKNVNKTKLKDFTDLINDKYALDIDGYQESYINGRSKKYQIFGVKF